MFLVVTAIMCSLCILAATSGDESNKLDSSNSEPLLARNEDKKRDYGQRNKYYIV